MLPEDHMPYERCIDILETELGDHETKEPYSGACVVQAFRIAIHSIKKQIPMYWKEFTDMNADSTFTCPTCDYYFVVMREDSDVVTFPKYCPRCGQRLTVSGSYTVIK